MTERPIDTGTEDLLVCIKDNVAWLTLNRPQVRNAMSGAMNEALRDALADFEVNPEVKCIVLTGAGKGFCAGGDVKGMAASGDSTVGDNTMDGAIHRQRINQRATAGIANRLANGPAVAYRYMKENLNRAMTCEVDECMDLEATHHIHCGQTQDHREAAMAFVEKREPVFLGR